MYKQFQFSQAAIDAVVRDIRSGNTEFRDQFFASRPEWQQDEQASTQTDDQQEEKQQEMVQI
jgi:hypothetical protein